MEHPHAHPGADEVQQHVQGGGHGQGRLGDPKLGEDDAQTGDGPPCHRRGGDGEESADEPGHQEPAHIHLGAVELRRVKGHNKKERGVAGLVEDVPDGDADAGSAAWQRFSSARLLTGVYGEDPFVAMCAFLRALTEHGLNGDVTCRFYHRFGYFEVTDSITGQVYAGINAYLKPCDDKDGCVGSPDAELRSAIAVAFSAGQLFSHITKLDGAKEKIVYILADNERIYNALCSNLLKSETKATVVLFTDDHCGFSREAVLNGEENAPISLVN